MEEQKALTSISTSEVMPYKGLSDVDDRGKVTMRSDRMLAEFHTRGGTVKWTEFSAKRAAGLWTYKENVDLEIDFTIEEAKEAGYIRKGSNWTKDPGAQLRARLITRAVRMLCPEAVAGVYDPEEMQDVYHAQEQGRNVEPKERGPRYIQMSKRRVVYYENDINDWLESLRSEG